MERSVRSTDILCLKRKEGITEIFLKDGSSVCTDKDPVTLLDEWCIRCGSTYKGRIDAYKAVTGYKQKCPVLLSCASRMCVYPLYGADNSENAWIVYNNILQISGNSTYTDIQFISGQVMRFECDVRIPRKQSQRCREYLGQITGLASESISVTELIRR